MKDNNLLDKISLSGIPPMPAGVPRIEVVFELDANGILNVAAAEKSSGRATQITISNERLQTLSQEQIVRMLDEAEKFRAEDVALKERNDALNLLLAYQTEITKFLDDPRSVNRLMPGQLQLLADREFGFDLLSSPPPFHLPVHHIHQSWQWMGVITDISCVLCDAPGLLSTPNRVGRDL